MWRSFSSDLDEAPVDPVEFVLRPALKGRATQCYVDRVSVAKGIYKMYLESRLSGANTHIMTAQRVKNSSSEYIIYAMRYGTPRDLGRLKSNVIGTAFTLYETSTEEEDVGTGDSAPSTPTSASLSNLQSITFDDVTPPMSPATHRTLGRDSELVAPLSSNQVQIALDDRATETRSYEPDRPRPRSSIRKKGKNELVGIRYEPNVFGLKGPRRMTIVVPGMDGDEKPMAWSLDENKVHLVESFKDGDTDSSRVLRNKPPQWNENMMSYTLDFGGRVTVPSVKNFQLIHSIDANYVVMQMGKCAPRRDDMQPFFTVDYQYPMTALQAFGIALSSFDSKLACE